LANKPKPARWGNYAPIGAFLSTSGGSATPKAVAVQPDPDRKERSMRRATFATSTIAAMLLSSAAFAQQQTQEQPAQQQQAQQQQQPMQQPAQMQMAEQCLADIQRFSERARQDGYGLVGPADPALDPPPGGWGWGAAHVGPRRDLQAGLQAAHVFARHGMEEECQMVLAALDQLYQQRMAQLEEAGIPPDEMVTWRQEQLILAQPVEELEAVIRIDDVIGADVRNYQDEGLGSIDDVIFDVDGRIAYVLVARGGFLGFGEDLVAVPWEGLHANLQMDTFVLDVPEEVMDQAPTIEREVFADLDAYGQRRQEIDTYWQQQAG
jgi:hypothetical protein